MNPNYEVRIPLFDNERGSALTFFCADLVVDLLVQDYFDYSIRKTLLVNSDTPQLNFIFHAINKGVIFIPFCIAKD